jgi:hypothetical protein
MSEAWGSLVPVLSHITLLQTTAEAVNTLPTLGADQSAGCLVCALSERDAKLITQFLRDLAGPEADKE